MEEGSVRDPEESGKKVSWSSKYQALMKLKQFFGHFGLFIALIIYTAAGAWVFQKLEYDHEVNTKIQLKTRLDKATDHFEWIVKTAAAEGEPQRFNVTLKEELRNLINELEKIRAGGLNLDVTDVNSLKDSSSWGDFTKSAFFASTVLTTIGYGDMAPHTRWGRGFCILFALIGIPFTLTVIADVGKLMAAAVSLCGKRYRKAFPKKEASKPGKWSKLGKSATVIAAVLLLLCYITMGAYVFTFWESWDLFDSFYFCFITMTTIGLGDLVAEKTNYMILCVYIMIGLALTSTAIELVRRQYADSWKKMRELSTRLQGLSGPLAETLKKYGDNLNLDVNVLQDLKDLKKALNVYPGRKREGSIWKKFWENEDGYEDDSDKTEPKLIQIIIYESSV